MDGLPLRKIATRDGGAVKPFTEREVARGLAQPRDEEREQVGPDRRQGVQRERPALPVLVRRRDVADRRDLLEHAPGHRDDALAERRRHRRPAAALEQHPELFSSFLMPMLSVGWLT
jgi:hypothetical protein